MSFSYWMKTGLVTLRADRIPCLFKASYCTIVLVIYYFTAPFPLCKTGHTKKLPWGSEANGYKDNSERWSAERQLKICPTLPYIIRVNTLVNKESQILTSASWFYHYTNTHKDKVLSGNSISDKWKGENSVSDRANKHRQEKCKCVCWNMFVWNLS